MAGVKLQPESTLNSKKVTNYTHFMEMYLKNVACWEWFKNPRSECQIIVNNLYLSFVLFTLANLSISLIVHLYTDWTDIMSSLDKMADGLPVISSIFIVAYFAIFKAELYSLVNYMNTMFKWRSAQGLTNMTMWHSYKMAKNFAHLYTACTLFSVTMYVLLPVIGHLWTHQPQHWIYVDVTRTTFIILIFLQQCLSQAFVALAMGQLDSCTKYSLSRLPYQLMNLLNVIIYPPTILIPGVFFACHSILLCGQLDLLCCSLRNIRYTALLRNNIRHSALVSQYSDIIQDEKHNYIYNKSEMLESNYHYDKSVSRNVAEKSRFDIYCSEYDDATIAALRECAVVSQVINEYKQRFENFVSPLLIMRVVQVTMYLCTLLYAATDEFHMITVEYLGAVALDLFVYCYFGNQIILQAARVSSAAYSSAWESAGARARRDVLHALLAHRRVLAVRAGGFLTMDLRTFVIILKTSFSYYTLLVNVNEK